MPLDSNPINIKWHQLFKTISGLLADHTNYLIVEREIIPIIFIPGIMGSRLQTTHGQKVWDPDSGFFMLRKYGMFYVSAEERKDFLIGENFKNDFLVVMNDDEDQGSKFKKYKDALKRGWAGVSWGSYGGFLKKLQDQVFSNPIQQCFEFPLHVFGYNWTGSNYDSGKALTDYIEQTIQSYKTKGRDCEKVILITHSMGGLVARSACCLHNAKDKVLGVLHGVQPATGSPAAYWRMKAGWERPAGKGPNKTIWDWFKSPIKMTKHYLGGYAAAWVLGSNGEEVTALLANMPGGLELLPTKDYVDNQGRQQWLRYIDGNGIEHALPNSDPYEEIYLAKDVFYRLVDPEWLGTTDSSDEIGLFSPWDMYKSYLLKAKNFHDQLKMQVHPQTFQFFSSGLDTADHIKFHCEIHSWGTKAKRMLGIVKESLPGKAVTTGGGGLVKAAFGLPAFTPGGLMISGALTVVSTIYKDTDHNANRGGFREYVSDSGMVVKQTPLNDEDWDELEEENLDDTIDVDLESETTWIYTLQNPDGSGDGTVPDSSSTALDVAVDGWEENDDDEEDVDAFGASTSETDSDPTGPTVRIADNDESKFDRGHEPIYLTKTGQHIAVAAVENFCLLRIREYTG